MRIKDFADLVRLKWSKYSLKTNEFTFIREKTRHTSTEDTYISFPLFPNMQDIIDRWGNRKASDNFVFPILKGGETHAVEIKLTKNITSVANSNLKKKVKNMNRQLPEEQHLPEGISTYTARHSFGTILAHKRVPNRISDSHWDTPENRLQIHTLRNTAWTTEKCIMECCSFSFCMLFQYFCDLYLIKYYFYT